MTNQNEREPVGYKQPPKATQFTKGRSGNPKGRPKSSTSDLPYNGLLGQMVTIVEAGVEKKVTAAEAFFLHLAKQGLEGDAAATRGTLKAIANGKAVRDRGHGNKVVQFEIQFIGPGNPNHIMIDLGMARKLDAYRPTARMVIEPWLVQAALARLGGKHLSPEEQAKVFKATRSPRKVHWPEWWVVKH